MAAGKVEIIIAGFKSIRHARLELKPVTVFIGPPDSGKSNTLEALGLASYLAYGGTVYDYFRAEDFTAISYRMIFGQVSTYYYLNGKQVATIHCTAEAEKTRFQVNVGRATASIELGKDWVSSPANVGEEVTALARVRFYRFSGRVKPFPQHSVLLAGFEEKYREKLAENVLLPPHGGNLSYLVARSERVADLVKAVLEEAGFSDAMVLRLPGGIEEVAAIARVARGLAIAIPHSLLADGLINYMLTLTALETEPPNWVSHLLPNIVAFEEPELHAFPYLVHSLAEHIAGKVKRRDDFFIVLTTHNPYMLITLLEKTPLDKMVVYYVYMDKKNLETRYVMLTREALEAILEEEYASLVTIEDILEEYNLLRRE